MKVFLICSTVEVHRQENISLIQSTVSNLELIEAVYPKIEKVPFVQNIIALSKKRTGKALLLGEIGCLLSHRKVWQRILKEDGLEHQHFLVLESDSAIKDYDLINKLTKHVEQQYDFFFWGAWDGHMQLFSSTQKRIDQLHWMGEPFIKTIYCTYGYSLNRKAVNLLLERTRKVCYPVDQFKRFLRQKELRIGGVVPELISSYNNESYIRSIKQNKLIRKFMISFLDFKNYIICLFR